MDWTAHLEYLQTVLKEFDANATPSKDFLICYFQNGLRLSTCTQMDKQDRELEDWQKVMERTIDAKTKAGRQSPFLFRESNVHYP